MAMVAQGCEHINLILNCPLEMVKMVNFSLYVFYHDSFFMKQKTGGLLLSKTKFFCQVNCSVEKVLSFSSKGNGPLHRFA